MKYWYVGDAARAWGVSERWVQRLLVAERIPGAVREGRRWLIPQSAPKPVDGRGFRYQNIREELRERLLRIDALKAELERRRPFTRSELDRIRREFGVEYTYDSNAIEGSSLTLRETALVLEGATIGQKALKEHLEAVGHRDAYDFVETLAAHIPPEPITSRVIRELHFLVLADQPQARGAFRTIPVRILGTTHRPPEPLLVPELMEDLVSEVSKDRRHPVVRAARFHLRFESIHPFIDGNGRTGRLVLNLMLLQAGYLPVNIKYADRERYYECFEAWDNNQDSLPMTLLVAEYAEGRIREWIDILDHSVDVVEKVRV
ncbi:MAG: Fic family protein [Propionibacteriaceae bacterium]|nr:Fic family protein [Propionibacteriaceae bacterium]